jgi:hypothetical protein
MTTELSARGTLLLVAAASSAAAGLVHAAAAGSHADVATLGTLFASAAAAQLGWAILVVVHPARWLLLAGGAMHALMLGAWAAARTVGWPVVDAMAEASAVGFQDLAAAVLAAVALVGAMGAWVGLETPSWLRAAPASALATVMVLGLAVPAMAADDAHDHGDHGHAHDDAHLHGPDDDHDEGDHAHGDDEAHHDEAHDDEAHGHGGADGHGDADDHDDPIISLDDPRLSENQRAAAQALVDDVRAEMARFSDPVSVEAEGYVSIGDGITGFEHFSHPVLRMDPITLDPRRPESIVFRVNPDGSKELVSAMFIMPPGQTMDDAPDIAGTLTTWHDHQDLCWMGDRVVGRTSTPGECAFGEFRVGQPMMHVWLVEHPCGPFAGLEGHGGDCRQHGH